MSIEEITNINLSPQEPHIPIKKTHRKREWSNPIEFLMTCIGFAVGLGKFMFFLSISFFIRKFFYDSIR